MHARPIRPLRPPDRAQAAAHPSRRALLGLAATCALVPLHAARAAERLLIERRSAFGTVLVHEDPSGLRTLRFGHGGARQSVVRPGDPDHLELAYVRAMPVAFAYAPDATRALLVGLGGGSLPMLLRHRMPSLRTDVVEIDPVVVEVARSHFGLIEDARLRVHVDDGRRFVERAEARWDVVALDAYDARSVPRRLATVEFLRAVRRVLAPGGVAAANVWADAANAQYGAMVRGWREVFDEVAVLEVVGVANRWVIGLPWSPAPPRAELLRRCEALAARMALRHDLAAMARAGLRPVGTDGDGARALRDTAAMPGGWQPGGWRPAGPIAGAPMPGAPMPGRAAVA
jgi:spermidine synthase